MNIFFYLSIDYSRYCSFLLLLIENGFWCHFWCFSFSTMYFFANMWFFRLSFLSYFRNFSMCQFRVRNVGSKVFIFWWHKDINEFWTSWSPIIISCNFYLMLVENIIYYLSFYYFIGDFLITCCTQTIQYFCCYAFI